MAASRFKTDAEGRMWVADLAALTDAELDQYLADNGNLVRVADTGKLPESFLERLRERIRCPSDAACSKPVDLDQVTARLLQAAATGDASPKPRSPPPDSPDSHHTIISTSPPGNYWRVLHGEMVEDGGRPMVPADLIDQVFEDPSAYREMLLPWLEFPRANPPDVSAVLTAQLLHWRYFRTWQKYNRVLDSDPDPSRSASKYFYARFLRHSPDYTEALRTLLALYDFNRPFQLHDDPARQDTLTTWIEYVGWVCASHYRFARLVEKHQPAHDEAWKTLVDTGLLRPHETREYLETMEWGFAADAEETQARQDVMLAQYAVDELSSMSGGDSWGSREAQALELSAANSALESALARQDLVTKRTRHVLDFIDTTSKHEDARRGERWHSTIMRWALDQLPLVEAEANTAARSGPSAERQNQDHPASPRPEAGESSPTRAGAAPRQVQLDDAADDDDGRRPKRLRKDSNGAATETGAASPADQAAVAGAAQPASSAPRSRRATRSPAAPDSPGAAAPKGKLPELGVLQAAGTGPIINESAPLPAAPAIVNVSTSEQAGTGKRKRPLE